MTLIDRFQDFFKGLAASSREQSFEEGDPRLAVAALCVQVMEADGVVRESEQEQLRALLSEHYGMEGSELDALIRAGREAGSEAVDYFRFTSELKRHLDDHQRRELVGLLWDMVYADGERSEMEDHALWRISELLGVSPRERIEERQKAAMRAENIPPDDINPV
jgi:uncharacterized tellurite resistance protein B-like protein